LGAFGKPVLNIATRHSKTRPETWNYRTSSGPRMSEFQPNVFNAEPIQLGPIIPGKRHSFALKASSVDRVGG
jgi:hypothetical protein